MVVADFSGNFLNAENCKQGDVVEIAGEGAYEERVNPQTQKKFRVLNVPVLLGGRELIFTPSFDNGRRLVQSWGAETKGWIGKKATVQIVHYKSFGQTKQAVELSPIDAVRA